jgi:hypothetical protein
VIIRIPINEQIKRARNDLVRKLSALARQLLELFSNVFKESGRDTFSMNALRNLRIGRTADVESALFELESRGFGVVRSDRAELSFVANKTMLQ